ncbi:hypothetical protein AJ79_09526 [Helicocarpus griseus UAMH5409]|uniref:Uncharacterized protein n=1 Tax=Helicocarpus griseus UAMH5409 TaxID=1447875 RepID=A0A2B7WJ97_9EURO|nr:hypothetical protein AJ79_09526 [Helicocarpus griseus UAMH5409]
MSNTPSLDLPDLTTPPPTSPTYKLEPTAYPQAKEILSNALLDLRTDHISGAKELATKAVGSLVRIAQSIGNTLVEEIRAGERRGGERHGSSLSPVERWWEACRKAGWILATYGRPSMNAAITRAVVRGLERAEGVMRHGDGEGAISNGIERMWNYLREREESDPRRGIAGGLREFLYEKGAIELEGTVRVVRVLTLSNSSTIRGALRGVLEMESTERRGGGGLMIQLRIMESRPLCEGVGLARDLVQSAKAIEARDRLHIEIASDASVGILAEDVDVVLLGADRISDSGDVSNKTGSLSAALCAKAVSDKVSVVVLSDIDKISRPGAMEEHKEEDNDARELEDAWGQQLASSINAEVWRAKVETRNVYFEWVPARYIDRYICETGVLDLNGIKEQSHQALDAERRLFGGFG